MKYYINYHTGAGDQTIDATDLSAVQSVSDKGAAYTQQPISIHDAATGDELSRRNWYGTEYDDDSDVQGPIKFGTYGYYGDWTSIA